MKRLYTLDGAKTCEQENALDSVVERTYHRAILVRRAWEVMDRARKVEARSKTIAISKRSLVLLMCQYEKGREGSKGKHKAFPPLLPTEEGKKRARVVLSMAVTPQVKSEEEEEEENEVCCLAAAIEASKAVLRGDDLAGPSRQAEASQDVGAQQEDKGQEEKVEVGPKATLQVQP
ncbi:hypothetical protein C0993_007921 [Termitomyces sp. T159_Od127]|nr:hypothetical protein C0993_007921 [Termitomyces sp. T159_Od127]